MNLSVIVFWNLTGAGADNFLKGEGIIIWEKVAVS